MSWKNWPYWYRGGIAGIIIGFMLTVAVLLQRCGFMDFVCVPAKIFSIFLPFFGFVLGAAVVLVVESASKWPRWLILLIVLGIILFLIFRPI